MADLKSQIVVGADVTGVEAGIARAKRSLSDLGGASKTAGAEASAGLQRVGDEAAQVAGKVDRQTRALINSVQRTTAQLSAGGANTPAFFESLARVRGADLEVLQPYLNQLAEVKARAETARKAVVDFNKVTTSPGATGFSRPLDGVTTSLGATSFGQVGKEAETAISRVAAATAVGASQFNQYGLTVKQTQAALRQVPAQLTDIFVSLQGGQAPLTVLLQQGGQLKDIFGGIRPAAEALGSALLRLINPYTVLAGAAVALAAAYNAGSKEADAYARGLILTGNAAGTTVDRLTDTARAIDGVTGTQAKAAQALAALTATGRVGANNLEQLAIAAIRLERDAGIALDDTVKRFAELGKSPVEAAQKLNQEYNFLTLAVFEQIRALQDEGRATEAAAVAQSAFADAMTERADRLQERLGLVERAWRGIKDAAKEALDATLDIGRRATPEQQIELLQARLDTLSVRESIGGGLGGIRPDVAAAQRRRLEDQIDLLQTGQREAKRFAEAQAEAARVQAAGIVAEGEIARIREQSRSNTEKLNSELKKYRDNLDAIRKANPESQLLDPARIARDEANIRERFRERRTPSVRDDAATRMLQSLREAEAVSRAQLDTTERLTQAERQREQFLQQIADLKDKRILTAEQKSLLAAQAAIRAQLDINVAVEREVVARDKAAKEVERQRRELERFSERAAQISQSIGNANADRAAQIGQRLEATTTSDRAIERLRASFDIEREFRRRREELDKATPADLLGSAQYEQALQRIRDGLDEALELNRNYYEALDRLQADWSVGVAKSVQDYLDSIRDVASQSEDAFTRATRGMEDAIVDFARTGKASFTELAESILADILRIYLRQQLIAPLLNSLFPSNAVNTGATGAQMDLFWGGPLPSAKGNVFDGVHRFARGSAFTNTVVDTPTLFKFARGTGLMGEAGPEAIVPLARTPDGRLGVTSVGGGEAPQMNVQIINNAGARVEATQRGDTLEVLIDQVESALSSRTQRGGGLAPMMAGLYGMRLGAAGRR